MKKDENTSGRKYRKIYELYGPAGAYQGFYEEEAHREAYAEAKANGYTIEIAYIDEYGCHKY